MASETSNGNVLHTPSLAAKLPKSWKWHRLDEVSDGIFDCPHSTPVLTVDGPFVVRSQDIRSGVFRADQAARVSDETYRDRVQRAEPRHGDLLYSREGTYFGIAAEVPHGARVCLGQRMVLIRPDPKQVDAKYLKYWLNSPILSAHVGGLRDGTVAERLNMPTIRALPVPLAPLSQQTEIGQVLGTLDNKIELNRRMNESLEAMARALFESWFIDFDPVRAKAEGRRPAGTDPATSALFPDRFEDSLLGKIPKAWRVGTLGDFAGLLLGGDWGTDGRTQEASVSAYCIRGADIPSLQSGGTGKMPIRHLKPSSLEKRSLRDGDLVVEISGGSPTQSTGRPVWITGQLLHRLARPLVCSNFCRLFRPARPESAPYIYLLMRWLYSADAFLKYENGTTGIKNLAFTTLCERHQVLIPPDELVCRFSAVASPLFWAMQQKGVENEELAANRDALLPKLLSGELPVMERS